MKITFLGVGEACDPLFPNTSILLATGNENNHYREILLDCGFTTPHLYFKACSDPEQLDALWISHFHGDHFFGIPLLVIRFWEMGRRKPLFVLGQKGVEDIFRQTLDLAYPGFAIRLQFPLEFVEMEPGAPLDKLGLRWQTAENVHSQRSLSLRIDDQEKSLFYSGDGRPTAETLALAAGCDLMIHEAFRREDETAGHGSIRSCLEFARQAGVANLALVHIQRDERRQVKEDMITLKEQKGINVFLPEPGDQFVI